MSLVEAPSSSAHAGPGQERSLAVGPQGEAVGSGALPGEAIGSGALPGGGGGGGIALTMHATLAPAPGAEYAEAESDSDIPYIPAPTAAASAAGVAAATSDDHAAGHNLGKSALRDAAEVELDPTIWQCVGRGEPCDAAFCRYRKEDDNSSSLTAADATATAAAAATRTAAEAASAYAMAAASAVAAGAGPAAVAAAGAAAVTAARARAERLRVAAAVAAGAGGGGDGNGTKVVMLARFRHYHALCGCLHLKGANKDQPFHTIQKEKAKKHQLMHMREGVRLSAGTQRSSSSSNSSGIDSAGAADGSGDGGGSGGKDIDDGGGNNGNPGEDAAALAAAGGRWAAEQSNRLLQLKTQNPSKSWRWLAEQLQSGGESNNYKTTAQCRAHWTRVINPQVRKGFWTEEEDERLRALCGPRPNGNWNAIAEKMADRSRTAKQCRERFVNYLDPALKLDAWTEEEDRRLWVMRGQGMGWADIGRALNGRAANLVKNRYGLLQRKRPATATQRLQEQQLGSAAARAKQNAVAATAASAAAPPAAGTPTADMSASCWPWGETVDDGGKEDGDSAIDRGSDGDGSEDSGADDDGAPVGRLAALFSAASMMGIAGGSGGGSGGGRGGSGRGSKGGSGRASKGGKSNGQGGDAVGTKQPIPPAYAAAEAAATAAALAAPPSAALASAAEASSTTVPNDASHPQPQPAPPQQPHPQQLPPQQQPPQPPEQQPQQLPVPQPSQQQQQQQLPVSTRLKIDSVSRLPFSPYRAPQLPHAGIGAIAAGATAWHHHQHQLAAAAASHRLPPSPQGFPSPFAYGGLSLPLPQLLPSSPLAAHHHHLHRQQQQQQQHQIMLAALLARAGAAGGALHSPMAAAAVQAAAAQTAAAAATGGGIPSLSPRPYVNSGSMPMDPHQAASSWLGLAAAAAVAAHANAGFWSPRNGSNPFSAAAFNVPASAAAAAGASPGGSGAAAAAAASAASPTAVYSQEVPAPSQAPGSAVAPAPAPAFESGPGSGSGAGAAPESGTGLVHPAGAAAARRLVESHLRRRKGAGLTVFLVAGNMRPGREASVLLRTLAAAAGDSGDRLYLLCFQKGTCPPAAQHPATAGLQVDGLTKCSYITAPPAASRQADGSGGGSNSRDHDAAVLKAWAGVVASALRDCDGGSSRSQVVVLMTLEEMARAFEERANIGSVTQSVGSSSSGNVVDCASVVAHQQPTPTEAALAVASMALTSVPMASGGVAVTASPSVPFTPTDTPTTIATTAPTASAASSRPAAPHPASRAEVSTPAAAPAPEAAAKTPPDYSSSAVSAAAVGAGLPPAKAFLKRVLMSAEADAAGGSPARGAKRRKSEVATAPALLIAPRS